MDMRIAFVPLFLLLATACGPGAGQEPSPTATATPAVETPAPSPTSTLSAEEEELAAKYPRPMTGYVLTNQLTYAGGFVYGCVAEAIGQERLADLQARSYGPSDGDHQAARGCMARYDMKGADYQRLVTAQYLTNEWVEPVYWPDELEDCLLQVIGQERLAALQARSDEPSDRDYQAARGCMMRYEPLIYQATGSYLPDEWVKSVHWRRAVEDCLLEIIGEERLANLRAKTYEPSDEDHQAAGGCLALQGIAIVILGHEDTPTPVQ